MSVIQMPTLRYVTATLTVLVFGGFLIWRLIDSFFGSEAQPRYEFRPTDVFFIGHAYGNHGGAIIPYPPLKKFLMDKTPQSAFFLGDLTEDSSRFSEFNEYTRNLPFNVYFVPGNHDGDIELHQKVPHWNSVSLGDEVVGNLTFSHFSGNLVSLFARPPRSQIYVSHYVWFREMFGGIRVANSMYGTTPDVQRIIEEINASDALFIAGDCGAFSHRMPFASATAGSQVFACTGMGGGTGSDHVLVYSQKSKTIVPVFFDEQGFQIRHTCKNVLGKMAKITTCSAR